MKNPEPSVWAPQPEWAAVVDESGLQEFLDAHGGRAVVKTPRGGYDGKGVRVVEHATEAADWFAALAEDAIGKRANIPLHRLWGHVRKELPVYGSGCFRGSGGDGMIAKALHYKQQGYKAIKMQMAHTDDLRRDVDNVKRMREALGPDIAIMIDINQGWSADVAINQGRKIADQDIYWLEEPVPADDFKGYMRVADALPIRIVGGETHFTRYELRPFFENPCCPILQPDPMRGGFTDLRKIAVLADTWGLQMAPHLFPELNVQLLASIPNGAWIEDMGLSNDMFVEPVPIKDGMITAPDRPGHGLAFKPEILKDCRV